MGIKFFTNDRFNILSCMQKRQIDLLGNQYDPLLQRQIAEIAGRAYKIVDSIMKSLRNNEYIVRQGTTRGRYFLTHKATPVFSTMRNGEYQK
jgi:predicted transcriptional regulator